MEDFEEKVVVENKGLQSESEVADFESQTEVEVKAWAVQTEQEEKRDVSQYARAKPKSMSSKNQYAGKDKFIREKSMSYEGVRKRYDKENNNLYKGKKSAA